MPRKRISEKKKATVRSRAALCCEYCKSSEAFSPDPFSVEHIIPISKNGSDDLANLAYSCQGCNNRKYNHTEGLDSVTNTVVPLFHPRSDEWKVHFQWNSDYTKIIGLTTSGRATVFRLNLNREGVVNLRRVLSEIGEHPPENSL